MREAAEAERLKFGARVLQTVGADSEAEEIAFDAERAAIRSQSSMEHAMVQQREEFSLRLVEHENSVTVDAKRWVEKHESELNATYAKERSRIQHGALREIEESRDTYLREVRSGAREWVERETEVVRHIEQQANASGAERDADLAQRHEAASVASRDLVRREYEAEHNGAASFAMSMKRQLEEAQDHITEQRDAAEQMLATICNVPHSCNRCRPPKSALNWGLRHDGKKSSVALGNGSG